MNASVDSTQMVITRTSSGPASMFGRGRLAALAATLTLLAVAYLMPSGGNRVARDDQDSQSTSQAFRPMIQRQADRRSIELLHFGLVNDERARLMETVGKRLQHAASDEISTFEFKFGLLADEVQREAYTFEDGWIFVTAGLMQLAAWESEIAAVLASQMAAWTVNQGRTQWDIASAELAARWMNRAGYNPQAISVMQQRILDSSLE